MLHEAGVAERMVRDGITHHSCYLSDDDLMVRISFHELTGNSVTVYGQTEVTADLYAAQDAIGATIIHGVEDVVISDVETTAPFVTYALEGQRHRLDCLFVAGCDGFHGVRVGD